MRKKLDKIFAFFICGMTVFSILVLGFVIYFIVREALPLFSEVSVLDFLFGSRWMPVDYTGTVSFGIFNFIAATIAISFTAWPWLWEQGWERRYSWRLLQRNGCGAFCIPLWTFWLVSLR